MNETKPQPVPYIETFTDLGVTKLSEAERQRRNIPYTYLVHHRAWSHTAFVSLNSLLRWADERGLILPESVTDDRGDSIQTGAIHGQYRAASHMDTSAFYALDGDLTRVLSNGDYTLGVLTVDENNIVTVHHLNPNVKDRPVFDYITSRKLYR